MKSYLQFVAPLSIALCSTQARAQASDAPPAIQVAEPTAPAAPPPAVAPPPGARPVLPPPAAPPPRINLATAAVAPPVQRTVHFHEGFYLRASLGFGDYRASFNDSNRKNLDFREHGSSMAIDLLIGGMPSPGLAIGGGLLLEPLFGADYEHTSGAGLGSHGGFSTLIGPFVDGYPDVTKGWHLGGLIGLAGQSFQNVNATGTDPQTAGGIGGAAWFGYDFWVANEWAIGPQLRLMGMRTANTKSDEDISAWSRSFTLGMSAVFN